MTLYADTQHVRARGFFRQRFGAEWITSCWSRFETINTLRQLCRQRPGRDRKVTEAIAPTRSTSRSWCSLIRTCS